MTGLMDVSKVLFGNQHLLSIAAVIADSEGIVEARVIEAEAALPASTVHRTLQKLAQAGLIRRVGSLPSERVQRYERRDHLFWASVQDFTSTLSGKVSDAERKNGGTHGDPR